jgi:hypothetical protein
MIRFRMMFVAVLSVVCACASSVEAPLPPDAGRQFSRAQLLEDVQYIFETIDAVHPNAFRRLDAEGTARTRQTLEAALADGMGPLEFWRVAAPAVARFRDGHTTLALPRHQLEQVQASLSGYMFPLVLRLDATGAVVRADLSNEQRVPPGAEVRQINGRPIGELIEAAMATLSFEREAMRLWVLNRAWIEMIRSVWGWMGPFTVQAALPTGEMRTESITAISQEVWRTRVEAAGLTPVPGPPYTFSRIAGGTLGYLDLRSNSDPAGFDRFLESTFTSLRDDPACGLVIDLRRNAGGSSEIGDRLMSYLTVRPIRQYSRIDVRASRQVKAEHRQRLPRPLRWLPARAFGIVEPRLSALLASPDGGVVTWIEKDTTPRPTALRWQGPVFGLIGLNTFSAATSLAAALQDHGIATLVGEETGDPASAYGEYHASALPHTGLRLNVSSKYFLRPSGVDDGRGVVPDMHVPPAGTTALADDPAIERILNSLGPACDERTSPRPGT